MRSSRSKQTISQPPGLPSFRQFWETLCTQGQQHTLRLAFPQLPHSSHFPTPVSWNHPAVSKWTPNFTSAILSHLHRAQKQGKPTYGDRSRIVVTWWDNDWRGHEAFWVLVMFHILSRMVFKQACSLCKSSAGCMLEIYAFYTMCVYLNFKN